MTTKQPSTDLRLIAEKAGVSISSVSRALNGKPGIGEKLRQRILTISTELNYQPSIAARELNMGKKGIVAISMERKGWDLSPFYELLFQALQASFQRSGLIPKSFGADQTHLISGQACAAIILGLSDASERAEILTQGRIPFISVESTTSPFSVIVNGYDAMKKMTDHLIANERKNIGYVIRRQSYAYRTDRIGGYLASMNEAGYTTELLLVDDCFNPSLKSYRHIRNICNDDSFQFDALVCDTDEDAIGVIAALEDAGIKVPDEVAVTGFDDLPKLASHLTTIHQDIPSIAEAVVEQVIAAIAQTPPKPVVIEPQLIFRGSA